MAIIKQYHRDTDTTYVYDSTYYWDPKSKQSRSKRKLIGKIDPATGEVIPTSGKRGPKSKKANTNDAEASTSMAVPGEATVPFQTYQESQQKITDLTLALTKKDQEIRDLHGQLQSLYRALDQLRGKMNGVTELLNSLPNGGQQ